MEQLQTVTFDGIQKLFSLVCSTWRSVLKMLAKFFHIYKVKTSNKKHYKPGTFYEQEKETDLLAT